MRHAQKLKSIVDPALLLKLDELKLSVRSTNCLIKSSIVHAGIWFKIQRLKCLEFPILEKRCRATFGKTVAVIFQRNGSNYDLDIAISSATVRITDNDDLNAENPGYSVAGLVIANILSGLGGNSGGEPQGTEPAKLPTVAIATVTASVEEGGTAVFGLSASRTAEEKITINVTLTDIGNFIGGDTVKSANIAAAAVLVN